MSDDDQSSENSNPFSDSEEEQEEEEDDDDRKPPPAIPPMNMDMDMNNNNNVDPFLQQGQSSTTNNTTTTISYGFELSPTRRKKPSGAPLCIALHCTKNAQSTNNDTRYPIDGLPPSLTGGGFCRLHYNTYLINSGKIESWDCSSCGNKIVMTSLRCGKCHRWKEGVDRTLKTGGGDGSSGSKSKKKKSKKNKKGGSSGSGGGSPKKGGNNVMLLACAQSTAMTMTQTRLSSTTATTHVPPDCGVQISQTIRRNEKGRPLCKVVNCPKMDQAKNEGFCRMHFNMFRVDDGNGSGGGGDGAAAGVFLMNGGMGGSGGVDDLFPVGPVLGDWVCACGLQMKAKNKRCGNCNRWRGGKREPYSTSPKPKSNKTTNKKKKKASKASSNNNTTTTMSITNYDLAAMQPQNNAHMEQEEQEEELYWKCSCSNIIPTTKSRCGKCHHWRGGKRRGGWKIKISGMREVDETGIDWSTDWTCCDSLIPAKKTRCGKCHKWRGGVRVARHLRDGGEPPKKKQKVEAGNAIGGGLSLPPVPAVQYAIPPGYGQKNGEDGYDDNNNNSNHSGDGEGGDEEDHTNITFI